MNKYCILIPTNHITQTVQEEDRSFFCFYFFCHIQFINILNESAKLPTQWMSIHHSLLGIGNMTIGYVCTVVILHNILCCVRVIRGILLPQWALPYVPIILPSANHSSKTTSFAPFIHWVHRRPTTLSIWIPTQFTTNMCFLLHLLPLILILLGNYQCSFVVLLLSQDSSPLLFRIWDRNVGLNFPLWVCEFISSQPPPTSSFIPRSIN